MTAAARNRLMERGQEQLAALNPATIRIGAQAYEAACSGITKMTEWTDGIAVAMRRIGFKLPLAALADVGAPQPAAGMEVLCLTPAAHAGRYRIQEAIVDPAGLHLQLVCTAPAQ
jgi:hypothetical protein